MLHAGLDIRIERTDDAYAALPQLSLNPILHDGIDLHLLLARVDRQHVLGGHRLDGGNLMARRPENAVNVGEVIFALVIFILELRQSPEQFLDLHAVIAGENFANFPLLPACNRSARRSRRTAPAASRMTRP